VGGKTSTTNNTTSTSPPQAFLDAYQGLINKANPIAATPYQAYGGQLVAGLSSGQNQAINQAQNTTGIAQPYFQQANQYVQQSATPISTTPFSASAIQQYQSPYTQQVIDSTLANINQQNAGQQNQLTGSAIASGVNPFGGDRAGLASAELARNQDLAKNQTIAGLENQGYTQALGQFNTQNALGLQTGAQNAATAANAAGLSGSIGQGLQASNTADINNLAQTGGLAQQQQQNELTSQYGQFQNQLQYPYQQLSWLAGITEGAGAGAGGQSTSSTTTPAPFFSLSDARMKDDKEIIGKMKDGTPIYRFRYAGSPETQLGLMAQDVEKRNPDAVARSPEGVKFVDYKAATDNAANYSNGGIARMAGGGPVMGGLAGLPGFDANSYLKAPYSLGMSVPSGGLGAQNLPVIQSAVPQTQQQMPRGMGPPQASPVKANAPTPFDPLKAIQQAKGVQDAYGTVKGWLPKAGPSDPTSLDQLALNHNAGLASSTDAPAADAALEPMAAAGEGLASAAPEAAAGADVAATAGAEAGADMLPLLLLAKNGGRIPHYDDGGPVYGDQGGLASILSGLFGGSQQQPPQPQLTPDAAQAYAQAPQDAQPVPQGLATAQRGPVQSGGLSQFANSPTAAILTGVLGALSSKSPYALQAIAEGGLHGLNYAQQQGNQQTQLDQHPVIDHSGPTTRVYYPSTKEWIDTGIPTTAARQADRQMDLAQRQLNLPVKMGVDMLGRETYGIPDPKTGNLRPIDSSTGQVLKPGQQPQSLVGGTPVTGGAQEGTGATAYTVPKDSPIDPAATAIDHPVNEEVLKSLPPALQTQVKLLAAGRIAPPSSFAAAKPYWQGLLSLAAQYDPQFDSINYGARQAALKDVTSGATAKIIRPLNTVMQHIDEFNSAAQDLNNFSSGSAGPLTSTLNKGKAFYQEQSQDPRFKRFNVSADAVSTELEKAFRGNQTAVSGIQEWRKNLSPSASPEEQQTSVKTLLKLLNGQLDSVTEQYRRAFGTTREPIEFLTPKAKEIYQRLSVGVGNPPAGTPAQGNDVLSDARAAIAKGLPKAEAIKRLQAAGIDASGL